MKWAAVGRYRFHWKVSSSSSSMWSKPCLVNTRFMELMQLRLFRDSSLGTRSSLSSNLPAIRSKSSHHAGAEQFQAGLRGELQTYWPKEDMTVRPCEAAAPSHRSGPWKGPAGRQPGVWLQDTAWSDCWQWLRGRQSIVWSWAEGTGLCRQATWAPGRQHVGFQSSAI